MRTVPTPPLLVHTALLVAGVVFGAAACGGSAFIDDDDDGVGQGGSDAGGNGVGGSTSGGSDAGGATSGGTSAGGTSSGGTGAGGDGEGGRGSCDEFLDDRGGAQASTFVVENQGTDAVYLRTAGFCGGHQMSIAAAVPGAPEFLDLGSRHCPQSCEVVMKHGWVGCPAIACLPTVTKLEPGGKLSLSWDGTYVESRTLPADCQPSTLAPGSCEQTLAAAPGNYTATITWFTDVDCSGGFGMGCECVANADGHCEIQGAEPLGDGEGTGALFAYGMPIVSVPVNVPR